MELPLFPLNTVLCPGIALPLHIFEERYRELVRMAEADIQARFRLYEKLEKDVSTPHSSRVSA